MVWDTNYCGFINIDYWPQRLSNRIEKIGGWMGSLKRYFSEIKKDMTDMENAVEDEISIKENYSNQTKDKKKDEWWKK